jgi:hypothetical protein
MHKRSKRSLFRSKKQQAINKTITTHLPQLLGLPSNPIVVLVDRSRTSIDTLRENIHLCRRKLPRADAALEQQVQFSESTAARLRKAEVCINNTAEANPRPEEPGIIAPVPRARVEHIRREDAVSDTDDVVSVAAEHDSFDL